MHRRTTVVMCLLLAALLLPLSPAPADIPAPHPLLTPFELQHPVDADFPYAFELVFKVKDQVGGLPDPVASLVDRHGLVVEPLILLEPGVLNDLRTRAAVRSGRPQPQLSLWFRVASPTGPAVPLEVLEAAGLELLPLPELDFVDLRRVDSPPPEDYPPATPDFSDRQDYRGPAPGLNLEFLIDMGIDGSNVRLSDVEIAWHLDHEDIVDANVSYEKGRGPLSDATDYEKNHGTAAIGVIAAQDNGYGTTGLAPAAAVVVHPEWVDPGINRRAEAIASAAASSIPGDVVLLEIQTIGANGYSPGLVEPDVWQAVRMGVDAGITMVIAAANGSQDLDSPYYQEHLLNMGDSGAIVVGSGTPDASHTALASSNYGSIVDVQAWGRHVFTLGYGTAALLDDDLRQSYHDNFNGTSSASALIAAACVLVQDYTIQTWDEPLSPADLRELLKSNGYAEGADQGVGAHPDMRAVIDDLDSDKDGFRDAAWGGDDCDDQDPLVMPGAEEVCDGADNDCDGEFHPGEVDGDGGLGSELCGSGCSGCSVDADGTGAGGILWFLAALSIALLRRIRSVESKGC